MHDQRGGGWRGVCMTRRKGCSEKMGRPWGGSPPHVVVVQDNFKYEHLFQWERRAAAPTLPPPARTGGSNPKSQQSTRHVACFKASFVPFPTSSPTILFNMKRHTLTCLLRQSGRNEQTCDVKGNDLALWPWAAPYL